MKTKLVPVGDSLGVRIPEALLEQLRLHDHVHLEVEQGRLIIRAAAPVRSGWDDAFREMGERGDDTVLDGDSLAATRWDCMEWDW